MPGKVLLTTIAMLAFAANSVLARLALAGGEIDAAGYTGIRLASGAITLVALQSWFERDTPSRRLTIGGSWFQAGALLGYAGAFSLAYLMLGAGTGALILFGSVQLGIILTAIVRGDRPGAWEWIGLALACGALVYLVLPGLAAPDPLGAGLMACAGACWAAYTLSGRSSTSPLADTAGNFVRCLPAAAALAAIGLLVHSPTAAGVLWAVASGAVASGIGYAIWYAAVPALTRIQASIVQTTVPALAALGAVILIGEPLTIRFIISAFLTTAGVGLAIGAGTRRRQSSSTAT